eukprot:2937002-Rhodomonas_salina.1
MRLSPIFGSDHRDCLVSEKEEEKRPQAQCCGLLDEGGARREKSTRGRGRAVQEVGKTPRAFTRAADVCTVSSLDSTHRLLTPTHPGHSGTLPRSLPSCLQHRKGRRVRGTEKLEGGHAGRKRDPVREVLVKVKPASDPRAVSVL